MEITACNIPGLYIIEPRIIKDDRGFFMETFRADIFCTSLVQDIVFVQDNHSLSVEAGTVRGLHYQAPPYAQGKLVRCSAGRVYDVAVDIRKGSPHYGQSFGVELTPENAKQLYVPVGFLHGFMTCEPNSEIQYKCTDVYDYESEGCVAWDDVDLAIDWPEADSAVVSDKDAVGQKFANFESPFTWPRS